MTDVIIKVLDHKKEVVVSMTLYNLDDDVLERQVASLEAVYSTCSVGVEKI